MKDKCLQFAEINANLWSETLLLTTETTVIAAFLQKWIEDTAVCACASLVCAFIASLSLDAAPPLRSCIVRHKSTKRPEETVLFELSAAAAAQNAAHVTCATPERRVVIKNSEKNR